MKEKISWKEKYIIALNEKLTLREIMLLRGCGLPKARAIRQEAIEYCIQNNLEVTSKSVLCVAVLEVTGYDLSYYYDKMIHEQAVTA